MHDHSGDRRAAMLAEHQHGVVTRTQLRTEGIGTSTVHRLATGTRWERASPEVLRRVGSPRTAAQSLMTAILDAGGDAALSHLSAAHWWGQRGCPLRPVHLTRTTNSRRKSELAVVHRVRVLPDRWTVVHEGVPVVRPELLAMQLFAVCSERRAERLTDRLWSDRLLSGPSIERFLRHLGRRGRNGTAGLRRYLADRGPGYVPPASGLESRVKELLEQRGIDLDRQVDSGDDADWTGRVDFRHRTLPFVLEIQSETFHTSLCDRAADEHRLQRLRDAGFTVLEVTDQVVWSTPGDLVTLVRDAIAATPPRSVLQP